MANYLLKPVFESVFDREFQQTSFEDRLEMQKTIYLLQNLGISVGNYNFLWYKHGPYSQTLQNDILRLQSAEKIPVDFSNDAKTEINALKSAFFRDDIGYSLCQWTECLGSIYYIKENLLPSSASEEDVLQELAIKKPHLNKQRENVVAVQTLQKLFA